MQLFPIKTASPFLKVLLVFLCCSLASCQGAILNDDSSQTQKKPIRMEGDDRVLSGIFCRGAFEVALDASKGSAVFIKVGKGRPHIGDTLFVVSKRMSGNNWQGSAFDSGFHRKQESSISIQDSILTVFSPQKGSYQWTLKLPEHQRPIVEQQSLVPARAHRSGNGCAAVQCQGTTKSGRQCRRTTSNCSGYCWQHE